MQDAATSRGAEPTGAQPQAAPPVVGGTSDGDLAALPSSQRSTFGSAVSGEDVLDWSGSAPVPASKEEEAAGGGKEDEALPLRENPLVGARGAGPGQAQGW